MLIAVVVVTAAFALPANAAETLGGRVVMGTPGAALPPDLPISIVELSSSGNEVVRRTVVAGPDGTFEFEGDRANRYLVGTVHHGVTYSMLHEAGEAAPPELKVYETTQDTSVISVVGDTTTVVQGREDTFEVLQLVEIRNGSDRTFIGPSGDPNQPVISMPVPEGAFDFSLTDPANTLGVRLHPRGMTVGAPLPPGDVSISYVFRVRVPRVGWQLRREIAYPTQQADLLIAEALTLSSGRAFKFQEEVTLGGRRYSRYRAGPLLPGSLLAADVGFPRAASRSVWWGFGTAVAALGAILLAVSIIRRGRPRPVGRPRTEVEDRAALIDEIASLDNSFEAGLMPESDYRGRRREMMSRLEAMSKRGGASPSSSR
ncbi:MAG: hypothetical protein M3164_00375 [Actinomycetota bacterium]|nr:hypothetical protein [Actinomycetota bacterium]